MNLKDRGSDTKEPSGIEGAPAITTGPMTVEEFFAFTDTRPDDGKWELIDGEPILNASQLEVAERSPVAVLKNQQQRFWRRIIER